ncbi:glycosyltransferase family 20 protein [Ceratobasidium sp. AG-Ba]|nr:glycosyltransferase family 20 protein [Ceratobasidium sp. AG-Ba]
MDDYSTPTGSATKFESLDEVRTAIAKIEAEHKAKGIALSGRIVHACHYLPISPELVTSPGATLPSLDGAVAEAEAKPVSPWLLAPRRGHTTMTSGIRSLSTTHEQLIVGWTGEFRTVANDDRVSSDSLSHEDRATLEKEYASYNSTDAGAVADEHPERIKYKPVWLDDAVAAGHYEGYCKTTLWPLFHYLLWQDVATEIPVHDQTFSAYRKANQAFADAILAELRPGDLVWIHDYHLLLLPRMLRHGAPDAHIGLFVHTPFPSSEVFRCLPRRTEILDGMLGANLVCFQANLLLFAPFRLDVHPCVWVRGCAAWD